jgi:hypothetical protein
MSCTRNKNTMIDYQQEEMRKKKMMQYSLSHGGNNDVQYAGDGFLQGRMFASQLSHNSVDIESNLFGINSTNLVFPATTHFQPQLKSNVSTSHLYQKQNTIYMPEPLVIERNQRPFY